MFMLHCQRYCSVYFEMENFNISYLLKRLSIYEQLFFAKISFNLKTTGLNFIRRSDPFQ